MATSLLNAVHAARNAFLALAFLLAAASAGTAFAQTLPWNGAETLKSEVYFSLRTADGKGVSEQAWRQFVAEAISPRFPDGLSLVEASGRSAGNDPQINTTRILIVVHANSADAQKRIADIKEEYRKRFGDAGVFHTDQPVRIAP